MAEGEGRDCHLIMPNRIADSRSCHDQSERHAAAVISYGVEASTSVGIYATNDVRFGTNSRWKGYMMEMVSVMRTNYVCAIAILRNFG